MATSGPGQAIQVDEDGTIHLGARSIPLPQSVSPEARRVLSMPRTRQSAYPPLDDREGWLRLIAEKNASFAPAIEQALRLSEGRATVETSTMGGVTVHVGTPLNVSEANHNRAWMTVHGGGFILLAGPWARAEAALTAAVWECTAYSVDYRTPPDHPFPAAVEDVVAVYRELLQRYEPHNIVVSGTSAGGSIGPAAMLKARDDGLPLPCALILVTPGCDLTESGDTFQTLRGLDPRLPGRSPEPVALYANGHPLTDPYLSPVFADFSAGFPPTYIQSGTRDILLSNCVRLHRALRDAEIEAELHVWEAALHSGYLLTDAPEAVEEHAEQARFLAKYWGVPRPKACSPRARPECQRTGQRAKPHK